MLPTCTPTIFEKLRKEGLPLHDTTLGYHVYVRLIPWSGLGTKGYPQHTWQISPTSQEGGTLSQSSTNSDHWLPASGGRQLQLLSYAFYLIGQWWENHLICYLWYLDSHHSKLGVYPVNMIYIYVTLVTITIVTGFPCLIPTLASFPGSPRVRTKNAGRGLGTRLFLHIDSRRGSSYLVTRSTSGTMATKYVDFFAHIPTVLLLEACGNLHYIYITLTPELFLTFIILVCSSITKSCSTKFGKYFST